MKKFLSIFMALVLILSLAGCGAKATTDVDTTEVPASDESTTEAPAVATEKKVITVSTKFVDNEQTAISLVKVVDAINERSNGSLELQLFTNGVLPIGKDGMEQIVQGSDWIMVEGINFLGDYVPDYNAVTGPFLYKNFDEFFAMMQTPLVQAMNQKIEDEYGIKVLSLDWIFGFRSMMTKTPITKPEDMRGLNIRVPTSQLYTFTIEAMGGNPVAMPYPDTYAALQQGVIDGIEGSIMTYYGTQQYENVKEYSLTNHLLGVSAISISTKLWDKLTEEEQTILVEEFEKGMIENLEETIKAEEEMAELLKVEGVTFHEVDSDAFLKAAEPVFTKFDQWTPGIYEAILAELEIIKANQ